MNDLLNVHTLLNSRRNRCNTIFFLRHQSDQRIDEKKKQSDFQDRLKYSLSIDLTTIVVSECITNIWILDFLSMLIVFLQVTFYWRMICCCNSNWFDVVGPISIVKFVNTIETKSLCRCIWHVVMKILTVEMKICQLIDFSRVVLIFLLSCINDLQRWWKSSCEGFFNDFHGWTMSSGFRWFSIWHKRNSCSTSCNLRFHVSTWRWRLICFDFRLT